MIRHQIDWVVVPRADTGEPVVINMNLVVAMQADYDQKVTRLFFSRKDLEANEGFEVKMSAKQILLRLETGRASDSDFSPRRNAPTDVADEL